MFNIEFIRESVRLINLYDLLLTNEYTTELKYLKGGFLTITFIFLLFNKLLVGIFNRNIDPY